jgi:hypothetical protein
MMFPVFSRDTILDQAGRALAEPSSRTSSPPLSSFFATHDKGVDNGPGEGFRSRHRLRRLRLGTLGFCVSLLSASMAAAALTDQLVLHLPLTRDLEDHSPLRQPIHIVGAVRIESEGAWFGGRRDWIEAPHIALNNRPFAVAMWIRESGQARHVGLIEQFDLARGSHHLHLMLRENRQPYFGLYQQDQISPVGVPWEQEWMHIVFQHTGQFQQIWINGRLLASFRAESYQGVSGVTAIGKAPRWANVPARDFVGHMRDVRIYHRHLEPVEIGLLSSSPFREAAPDRRPGVTEDSEPSQGAEPIPLAPALAAMLPDDPTRPFLEIDGQQVTVNARPGTVYVLETSADLGAWTPLATGGSETGTIVYLHPDPDAPMRFYRVRVEAPERRGEKSQ